MGSLYLGCAVGIRVRVASATRCNIIRFKGKVKVQLQGKQELGYLIFSLTVPIPFQICMVTTSNLLFRPATRHPPHHPA